MTLQETLQEKIPVWREEKRKILESVGGKSISEVKVAQAFGGMRGIKGMICDTSVVEPDKGLIIRGYPLLEVSHLLPEQIFYLLLTGDIPDETATKALQDDLADRSEVPAYVWDALRALPRKTHPMTLLNTAILMLETKSKFRKQYSKGLKKEDFWKPMLEDALNILGMLPTLAGCVYKIRYRKGLKRKSMRLDDIVPYDRDLDWGANYAMKLGMDDPNGTFTKLIQLYLTMHCDHEGGNVSANVCHTVGSALSDAYYAVAAGLNGLAGPLHGLANQNCLKWILELMEDYDGVPTLEQIEEMAFQTLRAGKVIPGYGHAVLRVTDPRFTGFNEFGKKHMPDDPIFMTVDRIFQVVPKVLEAFSKERVAAGKGPIANFWPNVDAGSGALLYHYGLREFEYYTVLFSVSRSMGMLSQLVLNRALGTPITRPKSVSTLWVKENIK
ncbi:MAG: citrate (Si)-synthase [FCB group bacterium]|nr:citrate (Si)-synthase [FCB group bacterium]